MSYETEFWFTFTVTPTLQPEHQAILQAFADGDRSKVDDVGVSPERPSGSCAWEPTPDGGGIQWTEDTKVYDYDEWLRYLIAHFLEPWGYVVNGEVRYSGESDSDAGVITVALNVVAIRNTVTHY
ncbi:MAG: hypothetical protein AABZ29_08770 [Gemmatimonadota bacterium]